MEKEFKSIEEQIKILKNRNLIIDDEEFAKKILKENNYYYLVNGYKDLFVDKESEDEQFIQGVSLEELYALYKFDIELRMNFFKYIISLERRLNTYIAYEFSKNHGHRDYLVENNFDNKNNSSIKIIRLINEIESDMMHQINVENRMLKHYIEKYEYIPLWVLIRITTFGQVSKFYALMKQNEQNAVAKNFGIREKNLKVYINNLAIIRNICAHDEKLFDVRLRKAISITETHKYFNLNLQNDKHCNGFKDLFSVVIMLKELLEENEFKKFYSDLIDDIEELKNDIKSIKFNEVLNKIGFPENYKDICNIEKPKMKKVFIICSKAFYKDIKPIKEKLEKNNWEVFLPHTYEKPEAEYEWYSKGKEEHAKMKGEMFRKSRERIKMMDAVLTLNFDKEGKKNYIGGSTFLELYEAFMEGKDIYLWNEIPEGILFDEINGFAPKIINGNLDLVK